MTLDPEEEAKFTERKRSRTIPTEQDIFGNKHNFDFSVIEGDEDKEIYLLLLVHGIGSDIGTQKLRKKELMTGI